MNFDLDEDQKQLRESVSRLLADTYSFTQRRQIADTEAGCSPSVWRLLGELGVIGLLIPEEYGGFGYGMTDLQPVMEEFGKSLLIEPFLASAVLGATALRLAGDDAIRKRLLPAVATGETILAWAHDEAEARHAPLWIAATAARSGSGWVISGNKVNVLHAPSARHFIVTARLAGKPGDRDGLALFLVDAGARGLSVRSHRLFDDSLAGELALSQTPAQALGHVDDGGAALSAIEGTLRAGAAALCADAVGAMQGAYALTTGYLNTRKQFGRLIGQNQALRHRASEMLVALEVCKSMAMLAAAAIDDPASTAPGDLQRAKLIIGRHGRALCQAAVQLHGGIGMTEEYAVGHYLRRIVLFDQLFGDSAAQATRLAKLLQSA